MVKQDAGLAGDLNRSATRAVYVFYLKRTEQVALMHYGGSNRPYDYKCS